MTEGKTPAATANVLSHGTQGKRNPCWSAGHKTINDDDVTWATCLRDWSTVDGIDKVPPADAPFDTRCGSADKFSQPTTAPRWRMSAGEATNQFTCQICRLEARIRDRARQFATVSPKAELVISQLWHFRAKLEANTYASFLRASPQDGLTLPVFASKMRM